MSGLSGGGVGQRFDAMRQVRQHARAKFVRNTIDGSEIARDFARAFGEAQPVFVDDGRVLLNGRLHPLTLKTAQVADRHFQDVGFFHLRSLSVLFIGRE